jgi:hypothetical protein
MDFSFKELAVDELSSGKVRRLYHYWDQLRGERAHPSEADIQLADIADIEPYLMFAQITYPPFAICYSHIGAEIAHFYGRDVTGCYLHDLFEGPMLRHFEVPHRMAMTRPLPLLGSEAWPGTKSIFEWGIFPLSNDGITITCNLVIEDYSLLNRNELPDFAYKKSTNK